jgi:hypothetical protein
MSLPGYKPYVISKRVPGWPPCGTYVDGGIWNNLPFREIGSMQGLSQKQAESQTTETSVATLSERRNTLGLRLEIIDPEKVLRGGDLLVQFLKMGLTAGEAQVIAGIEPFTIVLDTQGLDTLIFRPPEPVQRSVTARARRTTYQCLVGSGSCRFGDFVAGCIFSILSTEDPRLACEVFSRFSRHAVDPSDYASTKRPEHLRWEKLQSVSRNFRG